MDERITMSIVEGIDGGRNSVQHAREHRIDTPGMAEDRRRFSAGKRLPCAIARVDRLVRGASKCASDVIHNHAPRLMDDGGRRIAEPQRQSELRKLVCEPGASHYSTVRNKESIFSHVTPPLLMRIGSWLA